MTPKEYPMSELIADKPPETEKLSGFADAIELRNNNNAAALLILQIPFNFF